MYVLVINSSIGYKSTNKYIWDRDQKQLFQTRNSNALLWFVFTNMKQTASKA